MNNFRINNSAVSNSKIKSAIADALRPKDLPLRFIKIFSNNKKKHDRILNSLNDNDRVYMCV